MKDGMKRMRSTVAASMAMTLLLCCACVGGLRPPSQGAANGAEQPQPLPLPLPVDIPSGPADVAAPGGRDLPRMDGPAAPDAPAISMIGDATLPDETLAIAGQGLDGAKLRIWAEGTVRDVEPLRTATDRMQAVVPADLPASAMLVWPVKGGSAGAPIRVNGATVWWAWPARLTVEDARRPQTVQAMGKNLKLGSAAPRLYLAGPDTAQWLSVTSSCPYCVTAELPKGLAAGQYRVWAHNGTGGRFGWSQPAAFEVVEAPARGGLRTFRVDDFGAVPDDERDDAEAIDKATKAAAQAGGGVVAFSAGVYRVSRPIVTPDAAGAGIQFAGAGMGAYDPKIHAIAGTQSTIRPMDGAPPPAAILRLTRRWSGLQDLNVVNGNDGMEDRKINERKVMGQVAVQAYASDLTIERVRFVLLDARPEVPVERRKNLQLYDAALHILAPGVANIAVDDCEFHSAGSGIEVGTLQPGHHDADPADPSTDFVRIEHCVFRGYSRGFYKPPDSAYGHRSMGARNHGVINENGVNLIVAHCDFAGADRRGGLMMNRSILTYNTSIRNAFYAHNRCRDVGMVSPRQDRRVNQGEQILFHFKYPHGGYFDVLAAGERSVSVNPRDPRNAGEQSNAFGGGSRAGSRVLPEVGRNANWIVFVAAGKGVGQYRVVVGRQDDERGAVLLLDSPWRVVPDGSSRISLGAAYRHNIVYANEVDPGFIDPCSKTSGVLFWYDAFENIVAGCTFRNVNYGVGFHGSFRNPVCWNLVRDNVAEHMGGMSVEPAEPVCFMDCCMSTQPTLWQPKSDLNGWFDAGNAFRSNTGRDASAGIVVHVKHGKKAGEAIADIPAQTDGGIVMPVIENNRLSAVGKGVTFNQGCCWAVIRNNTIATTAPDNPAVYDDGGGKAADAMVLPPVPSAEASPRSK